MHKSTAGIPIYMILIILSAVQILYRLLQICIVSDQQNISESVKQRVDIFRKNMAYV